MILDLVMATALFMDFTKMPFLYRIYLAMIMVREDTVLINSDKRTKI